MMVEFGKSCLWESLRYLCPRVMLKRSRDEETKYFDFNMVSNLMSMSEEVEGIVPITE